MGDAGPLEPSLVSTAPLDDRLDRNGSATQEREVTVLVTGFGPFKSFTTNPSFLIASALPHKLPPQQPSTSSPNQPEPYTIHLLLHPSPIRVSYTTVSSLIPTLLQQHNPDYIFHIGVAGGRTNYTLETVGHRDSYKIRDVDERDGWKAGEHAWKKEGVPEKLHVGWDEEDVVERWASEVRSREEELGFDDVPKEESNGLTVERFGDWFKNVERTEKKRAFSRCQLSVDAGRFLCEFTLFESLVQRWAELQKADKDSRALSRERLGKVAFLHVPGPYDEEAIERGARVAEAAIRSLVASWEEGRRRKAGQEENLKGSTKVDTTGTGDSEWD
ncbi:uncharacterized protein AB675_11678 [Cyphellophora attinorum]|uniref:Pyroglutamyl-peptidase 1 n=1 Tax=Cyphellophora attinorum TaxID=1664694 RepID=A0A0N1HLL2_9EURO|nr:uncharacterized protein AB675_11678 [Phialophora attinorum]KPI35445.1 hypothetical protein AB675_11678 [Phialophora attinorum]